MTIPSLAPNPMPSIEPAPNPDRGAGPAAGFDELLSGARRGHDTPRPLPAEADDFEARAMPKPRAGRDVSHERRDTQPTEHPREDEPRADRTEHHSRPHRAERSERNEHGARAEQAAHPKHHAVEARAGRVPSNGGETETSAVTAGGSEATPVVLAAVAGPLPIPLVVDTIAAPPGDLADGSAVAPTENPTDVATIDAIGALATDTAATELATAGVAADGVTEPSAGKTASTATTDTDSKPAASPSRDGSATPPVAALPAPGAPAPTAASAAPAGAPAAPADGSVASVTDATASTATVAAPVPPAENTHAGPSASNALPANTLAAVAHTPANASTAAATATAETAATERPAPTPPPAADQLVSALTPLRHNRDGSYQMRLELKPPELGTVELRVELRDGVLNASMHTEHAHAASVIRDSLAALRAHLDAEGVRAGQLTVDDGRAGARGREGGTESQDASRRDRGSTDAAVVTLGAPAGWGRSSTTADADRLDVMV